MPTTEEIQEVDPELTVQVYLQGVPVPVDVGDQVRESASPTTRYP